MNTCPFCGSSLRHSWPPALWFECRTKIDTASPDRTDQTLECAKAEGQKLRQELDKAREEIQRLKGESP
jgi:hypothetical protein